jgi:hypothetical protein
MAFIVGTRAPARHGATSRRQDYGAVPPQLAVAETEASEGGEARAQRV